MKSTNRKKGMSYGKVDIPEEAFERKNVKRRVTAFIDLDVIDALKEQAEKRGAKYQTLLNQILRDHLFGSADEERIRKIVPEELGRKAG